MKQCVKAVLTCHRGLQRGVGAVEPHGSADRTAERRKRMGIEYVGGGVCDLQIAGAGVGRFDEACRNKIIPELIGLAGLLLLE